MEIVQKYIFWFRVIGTPQNCQIGTSHDIIVVLYAIRTMSRSQITPGDLFIATERALIKKEKEHYEHVKKAIEIEDLTKKQAKRKIKRLQYQLRSKEKKNPNGTFTELQKQISDLKIYHTTNPSLHDEARVMMGLSIREQEKKRLEEQKKFREESEREYYEAFHKKFQKFPEYLRVLNENVEQDLKESKSKSELLENPGLQSVGVALTTNAQFLWFAKVGQATDEFAKSCEAQKCEFPPQMVHILMNSLTQFWKQIDDDPEWKKHPEWKDLITRGYDLAIQLTHDLRTILHEDNYLVLPWFAIINFMLKPVAERFPVDMKTFEKECHNYIRTIAPKMSDEERIRCVHFSKCRYSEVHDGMLIRYRTIKHQLKTLYRPDGVGLLQSVVLEESKREAVPTNFRDVVMKRLLNNYTTCTTEVIQEDGKIFNVKISQKDTERAQLNKRECLLKEDSLFMFVVCLVFGYHFR